jgi:hypothetical protein
MYGLRGLGAAGAGTSRAGGLVLGTGTAAGGGAFGSSAGEQLREIQYPDGSTAVVDDRTGGLILQTPPPTPPACPAGYITLLGQCVQPPATPPTPPAGGSTSDGTAATPPPAVSTDWFTGISNWLVIAAGVGIAALFMMGGKHGR